MNWSIQIEEEYSHDVQDGCTVSSVGSIHKGAVEDLTKPVDLGSLLEILHAARRQRWKQKIA
jgi:hypothetical protein